MNRLLPLLRVRFDATGAISRTLQRPFGPQDTSEAWWRDVLQDPRAT